MDFFVPNHSIGVMHLMHLSQNQVISSRFLCVSWALLKVRLSSQSFTQYTVYTTPSPCQLLSTEIWTRHRAFLRINQCWVATAVPILSSRRQPPNFHFPSTVPCQSFPDNNTMNISVIFCLVCVGLPLTQAQFGGFGGFRNFFRPLQNFLQPVMQGVQNIFGGGPKFKDDGTKTPQATGVDKLFPDDCGREENKGTGKLCFPDGLLCQERKIWFHRKL